MEGGIALVADHQVIGGASAFREFRALAFSIRREAIRMRGAVRQADSCVSYGGSLSKSRGTSDGGGRFGGVAVEHIT